MGWLIVRHAKRTIGVSEAACRFLRHLRARNVEEIPNGVNLLFLESGKRRFTQPRRKAGNAPEVLYVGRLIFAKGVQHLLKVVARIKADEKDVHLTIVGEGPYRRLLEKRTHALKLSDRVEFLGETSREKIVEVMQRAALFVNPSYSEGLPTSVLEAAGAGLPVVATAVGGTGEIIPPDLHDRLLLTPKDDAALAQAITYILEHPQYAHALGKRLHEYVAEHFDWERVADAYAALFAEVVGDSGKCLPSSALSHGNNRHSSNG